MSNDAKTLQIDYGLMISAVQDESDRHDHKSTGYLNRTTGEIHFVWERYRDLVGLVGKHYEDEVVQSARVIADPDTWIKIERSTDLNHQNDSEALEDYAQEFLRGHGIVAGLK